MRTQLRRWLSGGVAVVMAVAMVSTAPVAPAQAANSPLRLSLPAPTGPYPVGATELHLVDRDRADPWVAGNRASS